MYFPSSFIISYRHPCVIGQLGYSRVHCFLLLLPPWSFWVFSRPQCYLAFPWWTPPFSRFHSWQVELVQGVWQGMWQVQDWLRFVSKVTWVLWDVTSHLTRSHGPLPVTSKSQPKPWLECTSMALRMWMPLRSYDDHTLLPPPRTPQAMLISSNHTQPGPMGSPSCIQAMARTLVGMHPHSLGDVNTFQDHMAIMWQLHNLAPLRCYVL